MNTVAKINQQIELNPEVSKLLNLLDDNSFVQAFCENPQQALKEANLEISLCELSEVLSGDSELYNSTIGKIANNIDTSVFNAWVSSCCSSTS